MAEVGWWIESLPRSRSNRHHRQQTIERVSPLGQYFSLVNPTKNEFISPHAIGSGAKLWEWAANPTASVFPYLLVCPELAGPPTEHKMLGRWANDAVALVGDYDSSTLYEACNSVEELRHSCAVTLDSNQAPFLTLQGKMDALRIKGGFALEGTRANRYELFLGPETTVAQAEDFLLWLWERTVDNYGKLSLTFPTTEQRLHGLIFRKVSLLLREIPKNLSLAEVMAGVPDQAQFEVQDIVPNQSISFQIAREYNLALAPLNGQTLTDWRDDQPIHLKLPPRGVKRGRLFASSAKLVAKLANVPLVFVDHTAKRCLRPESLGIQGTLLDWSKAGWTGVFPFLFRKSTGDGGGDGMLGDDLAGSWALHSTELRPDDGALNGYDDVADLVGERFNEFIEIEEYEFPL